MPLSSGVLFGLLIFVAGSILFRTTAEKQAGRIVMGLGVVIVVLTVIATALAAWSRM